jgi:hypothetical protein
MVAEPQTSSTIASGAARHVQAALRMVSAIGARLRLTDHYVFDDRVTGAPTVACFVAGKNVDVWDRILPRLPRAGSDVDVCITTPGSMRSKLRDLCGEFDWSYLGTATADASLAQNICYRLHPDAETIVKLDDDVWLLPDTVEKLVDDLHELKAESSSPPGFLAPVMPLHVSCYRWVLARLGHLEAFQNRFGPSFGSDLDAAIEHSPEAARWMWQMTAPLNKTAERLSADGRQLWSCDSAPGIGAMAFERSFWQDVGYLPVHRGRLVAGRLTAGSDEIHLVTEARLRSRPGCFTSSAFAGRFAHADQYGAMLELMRDQPRLFDVG